MKEENDKEELRRVCIGIAFVLKNYVSYLQWLVAQIESYAKWLESIEEREVE